MGIKGYKVFNPDWTCQGFQYKVGKLFRYDGDIKMCSAGFHFCQRVADCFNYYNFDSNNKVAEVEAIGCIETRGNKSVTDEIVILRELTWHEVLDLANTGRNCTGKQNTNDCNDGDCNSGERNSGHWNSGYCNSGSHNSGHHNNGRYNSGRYNNGNYNSGDWNNGNSNSGDWNSTNYSTGFFNSVKQPLYIFNKPANISREDFYHLPAVKAMCQKYFNSWWIYSERMTDEEKINHPEHETTGGYLKTVDFKTACGIMWDRMTNEERDAVWDIPNFDPQIFEEITGIKVNGRELKEQNGN